MSYNTAVLLGVSLLIVSMAIYRYAWQNVLDGTNRLINLLLFVSGIKLIAYVLALRIYHRSKIRQLKDNVSRSEAQIIDLKNQVIYLQSVIDKRTKKVKNQYELPLGTVPKANGAKATWQTIGGNTIQVNHGELQNALQGKIKVSRTYTWQNKNNKWQKETRQEWIGDHDFSETWRQIDTNLWVRDKELSIVSVS